MHDEFFNTPYILLEYALETIRHLLNLVPSKLVPLTPMELWIGCKLDLHHVYIWWHLTYVMKPKVYKLELRLGVYKFVRYPKGIRGCYFYSQVNQKVFANIMPNFWKITIWYIISLGVRLIECTKWDFHIST